MKLFKVLLLLLILIIELLAVKLFLNNPFLSLDVEYVFSLYLFCNISNKVDFLLIVFSNDFELTDLLFLFKELSCLKFIAVFVYFSSLSFLINKLFIVNKEFFFLIFIILFSLFITFDSYFEKLFFFSSVFFKSFVIR